MKKKSKGDRDIIKYYEKELQTRYKEPVNPMKILIILTGFLFTVWGLTISDMLKFIGGFILLLLGAIAE